MTFFRPARPLAAVAMLLAFALAAPARSPDTAEALTGLRAKITWEPIGGSGDPPSTNSDGTVPSFNCSQLAWPTAGTIGIPRKLRSNERPQGDLSAYTLWRNNTITRQSNPDRSLEGVAGAVQNQLTADPRLANAPCFGDVVQFTTSLDVPEAIVRVHQAVYGRARGQTSVAVMVRTERTDPATGDVKVDGPSTVLTLMSPPWGGPALVSTQPVKMTVFSRVPPQSQCAQRGPTDRVLTSLVRVGERPPSLSTPGPSPTATRAPTPAQTTNCVAREPNVPAGAVRSLNPALIVRTEIQKAAWAMNNGRATPTAVVVR